MSNYQKMDVLETQKLKEITLDEKALLEVESKFEDFNEIEDIITASGKGSIVCCN